MLDICFINCVSQRQNVKSNEYLEIAAFISPRLYGRKCGTEVQEVLHVQPSDTIL